MSSTVGWTVAQIATAVRAGEVPAEQVVRDHLEAVVERESELQAWAFLDPDLALSAARAVDRVVRDGEDAGPLAGVPVGVKDIVDVAGMPTRNGADLPVAALADEDATCVDRLRAAGAVPLGKTVTTEFALFRPGPTVNPHDPSRTPGGSSSGSATAVAADTVPLAIGTQTAGSIVRPASFCGVVGAKPTTGAVPRGGVTLCSPTLDTIGLLGRDVRGVATGLGVMADDLGAFRPTDAGDRLRLGVCRTFEWPALEASTRQVIEGAVERLADHLDVVEVGLPDRFVGLAEAQATVMSVEVATELAGIRSQHEASLSPQLRDFLRLGEARRWAYDAACSLADEARELLPTVFGGVDVLLAPSVLGEAPARTTTGDPLPCRAWTLLGVPCVAVPGLTGPAGLPLGVQVVAPAGHDRTALRAAAVLAELLPG